MKIRVYSFGANNSETGEHGTFNFTAKNMDEAESHRWAMHNDAGNPITCGGYVGPMSGGEWAPEEEARLGFVSSATLQAEYEETLPVIEHDPALLAEFIERRGRAPMRGATLTHNLLNPDGGVIEVAHGTPSYCDPSMEAYHCM